MNKGWICLHRKILNWEWYSDSKIVHTFLHCLFKANHKPKKWQGVLIQRGQFITSQKHLSAELNLSVRQIRTILNKLKSTGELTVKTNNKFSIISITNYSDYQDSDKQVDRRVTGERQTGERPPTTTNNDNNDNNDNLKDIEAKNKRKIFKPPNIDQVNKYLNERCSSHINGQLFIDHHQARGWIMSNRQKMKDWKAAVRTWISNDKRFNREGNDNGQRDTRSQSQRTYDAIRNLPDD